MNIPAPDRSHRGSIVASLPPSAFENRLLSLPRTIGDDVLTIPQRRGTLGGIVTRARATPLFPRPHKDHPREGGLARPFGFSVSPTRTDNMPRSVLVAYARLVPIRTANPIYHVRAACASIEILSPGADIGGGGGAAARVD